jgi:hypothetical protein
MVEIAPQHEYFLLVVAQHGFSSLHKDNDVPRHAVAWVIQLMVTLKHLGRRPDRPIHILFPCIGIRTTGEPTTFAHAAGHVSVSTTHASICAASLCMAHSRPLKSHGRRSRRGSGVSDSDYGRMTAVQSPKDCV